LFIYFSHILVYFTYVLAYVQAIGQMYNNKQGYGLDRKRTRKRR